MVVVEKEEKEKEKKVGFILLFLPNKGNLVPGLINATWLRILGAVTIVIALDHQLCTWHPKAVVQYDNKYHFPAYVHAKIP